MTLPSENLSIQKELQACKEKFFKLLEEKSLIEDEMISVASLARKYQFQAKSCQEELDSLKSSYQSICSQNSELESEVIQMASNLDNLNNEIENLKDQNIAYESEIARLKTLVDKEYKSNAIKELSYIILSKEHSPDSIGNSSKYTDAIKEALEGKVKSMEKEREEIVQKYRECLYKYFTNLNHLLNSDHFILNLVDNVSEIDKDSIRYRIQVTQTEITNTEIALENLEGEEMSFFTSIAESPKLSDLKTKFNCVPISFLEIQAKSLEDLLETYRFS